jgi:hypothetical protein
MISGSIVKVQDMVVIDELNDFRFMMKALAGDLSCRRMPRPWKYGPFPFRKVNEDVRLGNPRLYDLVRWYPIAQAVRSELEEREAI